MRMKSKGSKKGGKMKKYQAGTMVSPDERAIKRGNAAMDRISEEGTTNMMESSTPTRPKARPAQPGSKRPPKRPNAMDGRRKGDIKTEELLGGKTKAEINAAIDSGKNPKKKPPSKATVNPSKATGALARAAKSGLLGVPGAVSNAGVAAGKAAKKVLGMKAGGMMKKKGYAKGGMYGETATEKQMKMKKGYKKGGKMPDLTGDGKVTQADVLKGRGVFKKGGMAKKGYAKGGMMKKGYKKGGKVRGAGIARKGVRPAKMR